MANSLQARKRHRQSLRRQERNKARRTEARGAVRQVREAIDAGSADDAAAAIRTAGAALDRAARKGVIHPNNAARRKSRLMKQVNALQSGASGGGRKTSTKKS